METMRTQQENQNIINQPVVLGKMEEINFSLTPCTRHS